MAIELLSREHQVEALRGVCLDDPRTLRPAMRRLRLTIAEVSRASGIDYSRAEKILNGRAKARPDELVAIERAFGLPTGRKASA